MTIRAQHALAAHPAVLTSLGALINATADRLLSPWTARWTNGSTPRPTAEAAELFVQHNLHHELVLVTIRGGQTLVLACNTTLPALSSGSQYLGMLHEVAEVAAAHPDLAADFVLNLSDGMLNPLRRPSIPAFSFCRDDSMKPGSIDIPAPHYYVRPELHCAASTSAPTRPPFLDRNATLLGRFSFFCGYHRVAFGRHLCQRAFFSDLGQNNRTAVKASKVTWDVAPTNRVEKYAKNVTSKQWFPFAGFSRARYLLATDGWIAAGAVANLLALGSVVLRPKSGWTMYFDEMLIPFVHYVPLWEVSPYDAVERLAWLERNPEIASTIARNGEMFACEVLGPEGRRMMWHALLSRYAAECDYSVDDALIARRLGLSGFEFGPPEAREHLVLLNLTLHPLHAHRKTTNSRPGRSPTSQSRTAGIFLARGFRTPQDGSCPAVFSTSARDAAAGRAPLLAHVQVAKSRLCRGES